MESIISYPLLTILSAAAFAHVIFGAIYRLYLSPISSFPGPKLAALTLWYEFYYDVILDGQYIFHLGDLHALYGPIIRINPYELHVADSEFYEKLYASGASGEKRNKWSWFTKQLDTPGSMLSTDEHGHHKIRRAVLNRFFSSASVKRLQPMIDEKVWLLVERLRAVKDTGKVIKMNLAFSALTNDIVQQYAYGRSDHCVEDDDFKPAYYEAGLTAIRLGSLLKQMFWIMRLTKCLPASLVARLLPDFGLTLDLQQKVKTQVSQIITEQPDTYQKLTHPTIFHELLQSDLPAYEKTQRRIADEAWVVVVAGTNSTAWTLCVATYHLLSSPSILARLKCELRAAIPDAELSPTLSTLEKIPYLVAVAQEALRLSYGVATRSQRIALDALIYTDPKTQKKWIIPPSTPCSMTIPFVHHDEAIFPDSHAFIPERWIENPRLAHYLVAFSKGTRGCLGINLAYAELYISLAAIFRRFGSADVCEEGDEGILELYETDASDIVLARDGLVPLPKATSKGMRIKVKTAKPVCDSGLGKHS